MATSNIGPVAPTDFSYVNNTKSNDMTDKNVFFKILAAELSNQDPMSGKDGTEYVAQLAQFTALEQTQQLYTSVNRLLMSQSVTEAGMMIGKEVQFAVRDTDGSYKTEKGTVTSVTIDSGQVYLHTNDNKKYALEQSIGFGQVEEVKEPEAAPESVIKAGMMIGKEVLFSIKDTDGNYKTEKGIVTSVTIDSGQVYLHTKDNKKYTLEQSIGFGEIGEVKDPEKPSNPEEGDKVEGNDGIDNSGSKN